MPPSKLGEQTAWGRTAGPRPRTDSLADERRTASLRPAGPAAARAFPACPWPGLLLRPLRTRPARLRECPARVDRRRRRRRPPQPAGRRPRPLARGLRARLGCARRWPGRRRALGARLAFRTPPSPSRELPRARCSRPGARLGGQPACSPLLAGEPRGRPAPSQPCARAPGRPGRRGSGTPRSATRTRTACWGRARSRPPTPARLRLRPSRRPRAGEPSAACAVAGRGPPVRARRCPPARARAA